VAVIKKYYVINNILSQLICYVSKARNYA